MNDGLSVPSKKIYWFLMVGRAYVFKTHHRIQVPKTGKKACVKENKHVYLFYLCFGNSRSCVQVKSGDSWDGVSVKLKYCNSYDYIYYKFRIQLIWIYRKHACFTPKQLNPKEIGADVPVVFCFIL